MKREKSKWKSACIITIVIVTLLITSLIAFGATQNVTKQEQNTTLPIPENTTIQDIPENITSLENVTENITDTDTTAPIITILSPENTSYNTTAINLDYTINELTDWIGYSLNGANNVTIMGSLTFNASEGLNDLVVYARDTAGNIGKAEVQFNVNLVVTVENITDVPPPTAAESSTVTPKLTAKKDSFSLDEEPAFSFEYKTFKKSFIKNASAKTFKKSFINNASQLKKWVTENETIETFVYDYSGKLTDIEPEIEKIRAGKFAITLPKERAFRAGLYKLSVELVQEERIYVVEKEFPWGVLAINTHKSIYLPGEDAFIGIAVLDNEGHMVCDADVTLTITDPNNKETVLSTSNGLIKVSPECSVYGVTNLPDYYTNYTVSNVGTYEMNLTAVTADGTRSITDSFTVQSSVDFDVARDGPTRIYPPVPYVMNFAIKANKNYTGLIKEYVPASFVITPQQGLTVTTVGDTKILTWNKNLVKGETYNIYYEFDAPDVSPYLFLLGRLQIGSFEEKRDWMIASDDIETLDPIVHANTENKLVDITDVTPISTDDTNNIAVAKSTLMTVELSTTSQSISSVADLDCKLVYSTQDIDTSGRFMMYDLFSTGAQLGSTASITISEGADNTIYVNDLHLDANFSASDVDTLVAYIYNDDGTDPDNVYVDYVECTIDYTPAVADTEAPTYTNDQDNSSGSVTAGTTVNISVLWDDNVGLDWGVLRTNKTGEWTNESWHEFAAKPEWFNYSFDTSGLGEKTICWVQWANDTASPCNWNTSMSMTAHCFDVSYATTLQIRDQAASLGITYINVSGTSGEIVTDPYNNVNGSSSPQNTGTTTPVVTIYNDGSNPTYKIWLKVDAVTGWTDIISDEKFNVTADVADPGAESTWTSLLSWGSEKDSGVTVTADEFKDLYLSFHMKGSGTGDATISVLAEAV